MEREVLLRAGATATVADLAACMRSLLEPEYGRREADQMVRLVFSSLKGWDRTRLVINGAFPVSDWLRSKCNDIITRLLKGEPVQYILGTAYFYGMDLKVTPVTLIPRPETAELVDMIVKENRETDLRLLDIGTGSGAIAIALARNLRFPQVTATDISAPALEVARENARTFHCDIKFEEEDILTCALPPESFDIIVSNPPYIAAEEKEGMEKNVLDHEPHGALFVPDSDPLLFYRRIAALSRDALVAGGRLYFEINPRFSEALRRMLEEKGFNDIRIIRDSYGKDRFAAAINP